MPDPVEIIGVDEVHQVPAQHHVLALDAVPGEGPVVHVGEGPVQAGLEDDLREDLGQLPEADLAGLERRQRLALGGDVGIDEQDAHARLVDGLGGDGKPGDPAVGALDAHLHAQHRAPFRQGPNARNLRRGHRAAVMMVVDPGGIPVIREHQLLRGPAEQGLGRRVVEQHLAVGGEQGHPHREQFEHPPEPELAFLDGLLCHPLGRQVPDRDHRPRQAPVPPLGVGPGIGGKGGAVLAPEHRIPHMPGHALPVGLGQGAVAGRKRRAVRVGMVKDLVEVPADDLVPAPVSHHLHAGRIAEGGQPLGIGAVDGLPGGGQQQREVGQMLVGLGLRLAF